MRFYTTEHRFYCGVDLHARSMYVCILSTTGEVTVHRNLPAEPERFLKAIEPYRDDIAVCAECIFSWYWLADLCAAENILFVLGHVISDNLFSRRREEMVDASQSRIIHENDAWGEGQK